MNRYLHLIILVAFGFVMTACGNSATPLPPSAERTFPKQPTSSASEHANSIRPGVYLKSGSIELLRGRGAPQQQDLPRTNKTQPAILVYLPGEDIRHLQFFEVQGMSKRDLGFSTLSVKNEVHEIQPRSEVLPDGIYCVVLGGPVMLPTEVSYWCFQIGSVSSHTPTPAHVSQPAKQIYECNEGDYCEITTVSWSPDSKRLALGTDMGKGGYSAPSNVLVLDSATGKILITLKGHQDYISGLAWSPDGDRLASSSHDNAAIVWNVDTGEPIIKLEGHSDSTGWAIRDIAWSPDGEFLATASAGDSTVRIWDAKTGKELAAQAGTGDVYSQQMWQVRWSPDGTRLLALSGSNRKKVLIWDAKTYNLINEIADTKSTPKDMALSVDGKWLALRFVGLDASIQVLNAQTGKEVIRFKTNRSNALSGIAWHPDSVHLAVGGTVYNANKGTEIVSVNQKDVNLHWVAWSPDGEYLAGVDFAGSYSAASGTGPLKTVWIWPVTVSP